MSEDLRAGAAYVLPNGIVVLATPRDEVHLKIGQTLQVDPIPEFIGPGSDPDQKIHLQAYDKGKALKPQTLPLKEIVNVRCYEDWDRIPLSGRLLLDTRIGAFQQKDVGNVTNVFLFLVW